MIDAPESYRTDDGPFIEREDATRRERPVPSVPSQLMRRALGGLRELEEARAADLSGLLFPGRGLADARPADETEGDDAETPRAGLLAQLRAATTMQVAQLRARGEPPERMLCAMKRMMHEALASEAWLDPRVTEPLMRRVVRWSIDAYYDA